MKITLKEKICVEEALPKWDGIVRGEIEIRRALYGCNLCHEFKKYRAERGHQCDECPLHKFGNSCLKSYSTWNTIYNIIEMHPEIDFEHTYFNWKFAEKNIDLFHELFILCNRIRKNLEQIYLSEVVDEV